MKSEARPPAITAGTVPIAIATARRSSLVAIARLRTAAMKLTIRRQTSSRKKVIAAISVPPCRATSKVFVEGVVFGEEGVVLQPGDDDQVA
jgi:hypothetical protein